MKKLIINENWEQELVEDLDQVLALAYRQGPDNGYVLNYGGDVDGLKAYYNDAVNSLEDMNAEEDTKIYLVLLPNTSQVKALLDLAKYNGTNATLINKEATDNLLIYPDCEIIECWQGEALTEAKKKKKRKKRKTSNVTYLVGFPWLNDHRFNHAMGSCGCNKNPGEDAAGDINDAIGGGESVGDAGSAEGDFGGDMGSSGGEGGGMGESLVNEAMTPLDKMRALEAGTRGFNAAAASDKKLYDNLIICAKNNLVTAAAVMIMEIQKRMNQGVWTLGPIPGLTMPTKTQTPINQPQVQAAQPAQPVASTNSQQPTLKLTEMDFHPADLIFIKDNINDYSVILANIANDVKQSIITLIFTLVCGYSDLAKRVKEYTLSLISKEELKQIIMDCRTNSNIIDRITKIHNEFINEGVSKMTNLNEAKRYIKRYYIRPQNIFCSNKAEILNALVKEVGENNCSVYSLKALDDHDDVHLLQPKDIIYYYDDGILYDKNHVKVMDYDLNVKHEEERKKFGNVDAISDQTFDAEYEDRLTESPHYDPADYWDEDPDWMHVSRKTKSVDWDIINKARKQKYGQGYTTYGKASKANVSAGTYTSIYGACDATKAKEAFEKHLGEHKLDVRNFHAAYDNILEDEGVLGVFNKDGVMRGKGVYGQIKDCKNYRVKAILTKFWVAQFKDNCEIYYGTFGEALTENLGNFNVFSLDFTDVNVYGEKLHEGKVNEFVCCICGEEAEGYGNNPSPVKEDGKCCDACNRKFVIPARLEDQLSPEEE